MLMLRAPAEPGRVKLLPCPDAWPKAFARNDDRSADPANRGWTWSRPLLATILVPLAGWDPAAAASSPQMATTTVIAGL